MRKEEEAARMGGRTSFGGGGGQQRFNGDSFPSKSITTSIDSRFQYCLGGRFHILTGMKFLILIGVISIITILVLESIYFRRAIFILLIPSTVTASTIIAILKQSPRLIWPIVGISPVYILMVLNWAFDTITTVKGPLFYVKCACIVAILIAFILLNLWQLRLSLRFRDFLRHQESFQTLIMDSSSCVTTNTTQLKNNNNYGVQPHSKMLNEPPIIFQNSLGHQSRLSQPPPPPPPTSALKFRDESSLNGPSTNRRSSMYSQSNHRI